MSQHDQRIVKAACVSVNQVGYFPTGVKYAVFSGSGESPSGWSLTDAASGMQVAHGLTETGRFDPASGDVVKLVDFSAITTPGNYILTIDNVQSVPFQIGTTLYHDLSRDALRYFYLNRCGTALDPQYAGEWARAAGHLTDSNVTCYRGTDADGKTWDGCDYRLDAGKGWYDAGDYGKYVVNAGITVWTLLNAYERQPDYFAALNLNIPESGNGEPDILSEVRWEMAFLLGMQVSEGQPLAGMVHHKLHDIAWSGVPSMPLTEVENDDPAKGRFVYPPSTAATLNLAAVAAQCARVWRELDADFAQRCLTAAETAWQAAQAHPVMLAGNTPGTGGGNYDDTNITDEQYWAAAELFVTTGKAEYCDFIVNSPYFTHLKARNGTSFSAMNWGNTAALGTISLTTIPNPLDETQIKALRQQIAQIADVYLATMASEGYRVPLEYDQYVWGSNSDVLNSALLLALAHDFTQDERYLNGMIECMDYLLGRNTHALSFVAGYGERAFQHPHHRFWGNQPQDGYPAPPPGAISGGPNGHPSDPPAATASLMDLPPARRYLDDIGSYSTNEVAINWNAPLVWVAAYLDAYFDTSAS